MFKVVKCKLGDLLKKADKTQTELAESTGILKSRISEYVNTKHVMSLETAKTISTVLNCSIEELYQWEMVTDESNR